MTSFYNLPTEIVAYIIQALLPRELRENDYAVLRVCRLFHALGQPYLLNELELVAPSLHRYRGLSSERKRVLSNNVQSLTLNLEGPERHRRFTAPCGARFLCIHDQIDRYFSIDRWKEGLNDGLVQLTQDIPYMHRLESFTLRTSCAECQQKPWPSGCLLGQSFVQTRCLSTLMKGLGTGDGAGARLTTLTIDVGDAEESQWSLDNGSTNHVCGHVARAVRRMPKLREMKLRLRNICPAVLWCDDLEEGQLAHRKEDFVHPSLQSLIINLRMAETQRTSVSTWEAQARPCGQTCHCASCTYFKEELGDHLRRSSYDSEDYGEPSPARALFEDLVISTKAFASKRMPNAKEVRIIGYERPAEELPNYRRRPCYVDCLTGKKTTTEWPWRNEGAGLGPVWDHLTTVPMAKPPLLCVSVACCCSA